LATGQGGVSLDIDTERGRETLEYERRAARALERATGHRYVAGSKAGSAWPLDAVVADPVSGDLVAVVEQKTRSETVERMKSVHGGTLILSADKVRSGIVGADLLGCAFWVLVYLRDEPDAHRVVLIDVYNQQRGLLPGIRWERTKTRATVNGGEAHRLNCYIPLLGGRLLRDAEDEK